MRRSTARALVPAALLAGVLAGCSTSQAESASSTTDTDLTQAVEAAASTTTVDASVAEVLAANTAWHTADTAEATTETSIALTGTSAGVDGSGAEVDGSTVTLTGAGTYRITGSLSDGTIVVDSSDAGTVRVILDGVDVSSSTTAALQVTEADDVVVELAEGSLNSLSDTSTAADAETDAPNAALWSSADLTITGTGALTVAGNANDGITSKDDLVIESGTLTVTAADDGIRGKDALVILGGTLDVTAGGDGLTSDNDEDAARGYVYLQDGTVTVRAGDDGVAARTDVAIAGGTLTVEAVDDGVKADAVVVIGGGTLAVTGATEGLEGERITIAGGATSLVTSDDGINASSSDETAASGEGADPDLLVTISGGTLTIDSGGDGLDSNGSLTMTGGTVVVAGPTQDNNGSIDVNGTFDVSGGELIAVGSSGMAETPSADSAQSFVALTLGSTQPAGTVVHVVDDEGTVLASFTATKDFSSVVYSSPDVVSGATYTAMVGGAAGSDDLAGLSHGGSAAGAVGAATGTAGQESSGTGGGGQRSRP